MAYFASGEELQDELVAFLTDFVGSDDGRRAAEGAREYADSAGLLLRTVDPSTVVSVDFLGGQVSREEMPDADVEIELGADDLHNILLHRLGPVEISALIEDDHVTYSGDPTKLGGLFLLAGPMQPYYPASLERRGRHDLLETPEPPTRRIWESRGEIRPMYGVPRPWQRQKGPKRTSPATA